MHNNETMKNVETGGNSWQQPSSSRRFLLIRKPTKKPSSSSRATPSPLVVSSPVSSTPSTATEEVQRVLSSRGHVEGPNSPYRRHHRQSSRNPSSVYISESPSAREMENRETPFSQRMSDRSPSPSGMPSLKPMLNDGSFSSRRPSSSSNGTALPSSVGGGSSIGGPRPSLADDIPGGSTTNVVVVSVMVPAGHSNGSAAAATCASAVAALRAPENPADVHLFEGAFMDSKVKGYIEKESMLRDDSFTLIDFSTQGAGKSKTSGGLGTSKAGSSHSQLSRLKMSNVSASSQPSLTTHQYWNEVCQLCCVEYEGRLRLYRSWLEIVNKIFMVKHVIVELVPKDRKVAQNRSMYQIAKLNRYWDLLLSCTMETQLVWAIELYDKVYTPAIQTYQFPVDKRNSLSLSSSTSYGTAAGVASGSATHRQSIWTCYYAIMNNLIEFTSTASRLEAEGGENMMKLLLPATVSSNVRSSMYSPKSMKHFTHHAEGTVVDPTTSAAAPSPYGDELPTTSSVLQRLLYENHSLGDCPIPYHLLLPSPDASWNSMLRLSKRWIIYACVTETTLKPLPSLSTSKTPLTDVERRLHVLQDIERTGRECLTEIFLESLVILTSLPACYQKVAVPAHYSAIIPDMVFPFPAAPNNANAISPDHEKPTMGNPSTVSPTIAPAFQPSYLENSLMLLQMDTSRGQHPGNSLVASSFFHNSHLNRSVISPNTGGDRPFASRCDGEFMSITTLDSGRESLADISLDASLRYLSITSPKKITGGKTHTSGENPPLSRSRTKPSSHNLLNLGQTVRASNPSYYGTPTMDVHSSLAGDGDGTDRSGVRRSMNWMNLARSLSVLDTAPAIGALWPSRASGQVSQHYLGLGSSFNPGNSSLRPPSSMYSFQNPPMMMPSIFANSRDERSLNLVQSFEKVVRDVWERREFFARLIIRKRCAFARSQMMMVKLLQHSLEHARGIAIVRAPPRIRQMWHQVEEEKMLMVHQLMRQIEFTVLEYQAAATMMQEVDLHQRFLNDLARERELLKVTLRSEKEKLSGGATGRPVSNSSRLHGSSGKSGDHRSPFHNTSCVDIMPMNSISAMSPNSRRLNIPNVPSHWAAAGGLDFAGTGLGLGGEDRHVGLNESSRFMVNHHFLSTPENSRHFPESSPLLKMKSGTPNMGAGGAGGRRPVVPAHVGVHSSKSNNSNNANNNTSSNNNPAQTLLNDLELSSRVPFSLSPNASSPNVMLFPPSSGYHQPQTSGTFHQRTNSNENHGSPSSTQPAIISPLMPQQELLGGAAAPPLQMLNLNSRIAACFQGIEDNATGRFYGFLDYIPTTPSSPDAFFKALNALHAISTEIKNYVTEHHQDNRRASASSFMASTKITRVKQIFYANGDSYEGGWMNGERHLLGVYSFGQVGFWYAGGWLRNVPHGDGVLLRISVGNTACAQQTGGGGSAADKEIEGEKTMMDHNVEFLQVLMEQLRRRQEGLPPMPTAREKPRPAVHIVFGSWTRGELSKVLAVFCNLSK